MPVSIAARSLGVIRVLRRRFVIYLISLLGTDQTWITSGRSLQWETAATLDGQRSMPRSATAGASQSGLT